METRAGAGAGGGAAGTVGELEDMRRDPLVGDARVRANGRYAGELALRQRHPFELQPGELYLVTGAAGFIGSHLTCALTALGCRVLGIDAFRDNYSLAAKRRNLEVCFASGGVGFAELDLATVNLAPLVAEADGIFHLAGRPGVRTSWGPSFDYYLHDNLSATQRVFEAAVERGIRVVYASSSSVYGAADAYPLREDAKPVPVSPYGVSKLACEALAGAYAESAGLDAVGMRFFSVYGPRQRPDMAFAAVFDSLAGERPFRLYGNGRQTRDFTFVGDVVEATLSAMTRAPAGRVYNVGGGSEMSLLDALGLCERVAGRRLDLVHDGAGTGDARRTLADYGLAEAELGWRPRTSLEDGLRAQLEAAWPGQQPMMAQTA
jgi:nucleoside-diphosphate-sugar epimerase